MKKNTLCKGALAVAALCTTFGTIVPFNNTYIEAQEEVNVSTNVAGTKDGTVALNKIGDTQYSFGNGYLKRTFSITDGKLKTDSLTNYRTDGETVMTPATGSEEFVIKTLANGLGETEETVTPPTEKIQNEGWTVSADSWQKDSGSGDVEHMFDNDSKTFYHSKYDKASDDELKYPHNIFVDFKKENTFKSVYYKQRVDQADNPTVSGHVNEFKLYVADSQEKLKEEGLEPVFTGTFDDAKETYVNLPEAVTAQHVRIEFASAHKPKAQNVDENVACCSEFAFFADEAIIPQKAVDTIKASELELEGNPVQASENGRTTATFTFKPIEVRGVTYNIQEVLSMKDGESFMRKRLEIEVPEEKAADAKIDYIDLENMNFAASDVQGTGSNQDANTNFWTIPEQANNDWMAGMKGDYLELGQPYYVGSMYWGCEFPQAENKIRNNNGFIRYHYGKNLAVQSSESDGQFNLYNDYNNAGGQSGKMVTWDAVVGSARSRDYQVVQSDFYEYIETIATDTNFRQQYNSWYDNMKNITNTNILESFAEVEKGFTQKGVNPLDSYVVDDGWVDYSTFWGFNGKFPNRLDDPQKQVEKMGSNFGLWLGPRGGYGTERQIANAIANAGEGSVNEQAGSDINISDARYLNKLTNDILINYQDTWNINYWKLDGMLLNPSTDTNEYHVTGKPEYTISETYERWTDMFEDMRAARGDKDLWINMTSFANPSPWHLQWVNSVWMQNTGDGGFTYDFGSSDQEAQLTYRDNSYYEFFHDRQWQLPNKYFYNHDPIYGKTANQAPNGKPNYLINHTTEEFREHLFMLGTRGTAFWEYYYSPSMLDDEKWQVNAEAAKWIESNFDILQKSKMFGGKPNDGKVYGYSCWNGNEGIVSVRNPGATEQKYSLKLDNIAGVSEAMSGLHAKVIIGSEDMIDNYSHEKTVKYGDTLDVTLKPKDVLIIQYGEQDVTPASLENITVDNNVVRATFDEAIQTPAVENFTVKAENAKADNKVESVKLDADLRSVLITLKDSVKDTADVTVSVKGIKDTVGNVTDGNITDDYYKNGLINGISNKDLNGEAITMGNKYTVDGNKPFSVSGKVTTSSKNAELVSQGNQYSVSINAEGKLVFTVKGLTVVSENVIADGQEHQFAVVKEANGMLKVYVDGKVENSAYDPGNINPMIQKEGLSFGKGLQGHVDYITIHDTGLGFDDVAGMIPESNDERNVVSSRNNKDVKISAYDVTDKKPVPEKSDRSFKQINDGVKNTDNYLELKDTDNNKAHSRYVEIDLGDTYTLNKLHLTRYFGDKRTYNGTVIALSNDKDFNKKEIVYNSDKNNVHELGKGSDDLYQETAEGKEILLKKPIDARYIRIYVNGNANGQSSSDHLVEFEGYGVRTTNPEENRPISPERPDGNVNPGQPNPEKPETGDVNKDRLSALVEESGKLVEKDYTKDSWKNFVVALNQAKDVLSNKEATQEQVDAAVKALEKAKADLKLVGGSITNKPGQQSGTNKPGQQSGTNKPGQKPNKNEGTNTGTRTFASVFGIASIASVGTMLALIEAKRRKMDR